MESFQNKSPLCRAKYSDLKSNITPYSFKISESTKLPCWWSNHLHGLFTDYNKTWLFCFCMSLEFSWTANERLQRLCPVLHLHFQEFNFSLLDQRDIRPWCLWSPSIRYAIRMTHLHLHFQMNGQNNVAERYWPTVGWFGGSMAPHQCVFISAA